MNNQEHKFEWQEIKEIWTSSSQTKQINIQMSNLFNELTGKISQYEKESIKSDIATLKTNWLQTKGKVSQFEKHSINKDLIYFSRLLKRFLNLFNPDK